VAAAGTLHTAQELVEVRCIHSAEVLEGGASRMMDVEVVKDNKEPDAPIDMS
jgi:hypothetical protein